MLSLASIDTAISYISNAITHTERIYDAMFATIFTFPLPHPAQQRVDDRERVMDRPIFYDKPHTLIASFDDGSRLLLKVAADREGSRLPLFPAHFSVGDTGTKCLDEWPHSFDPGEWLCYWLALFLLFYPGGKSTLVLQPVTGLNENTPHSPNPRAPLRSPASNGTHRRDEG